MQKHEIENAVSLILKRLEEYEEKDQKKIILALIDHYLELYSLPLARTYRNCCI